MLCAFLILNWHFYCSSHEAIKRQVACGRTDDDWPIAIGRHIFLSSIRSRTECAFIKVIASPHRNRFLCSIWPMIGTFVIVCAHRMCTCGVASTCELLDNDEIISSRWRVECQWLHSFSHSTFSALPPPNPSTHTASTHRVGLLNFARSHDAYATHELDSQIDALRLAPIVWQNECVIVIRRCNTCEWTNSTIFDESKFQHSSARRTTMSGRAMCFIFHFQSPR